MCNYDKLISIHVLERECCIFDVNLLCYLAFLRTLKKLYFCFYYTFSPDNPNNALKEIQA